MTLDEFTVVVQYLQSPDSEIVELGRVLGEQMGLDIKASDNYNSWIRTTTGYARISSWRKVRSIEKIYATAIW